LPSLPTREWKSDDAPAPDQPAAEQSVTFIHGKTGKLKAEGHTPDIRSMDTAPAAEQPEPAAEKTVTYLHPKTGKPTTLTNTMLHRRRSFIARRASQGGDQCAPKSNVGSRRAITTRRSS
jgi:hypothetical protein